MLDIVHEDEERAGRIAGPKSGDDARALEIGENYAAVVDLLAAAIVGVAARAIETRDLLDFPVLGIGQTVERAIESELLERNGPPFRRALGRGRRKSNQ